MGGALALHFGYRFCIDLAGVFALSSFLNEKSSVFEVIRLSILQGSVLLIVYDAIISMIYL